jgi:hypothetical protein
MLVRKFQTPARCCLQTHTIVDRLLVTRLGRNRAFSEWLACRNPSGFDMSYKWLPKRAVRFLRRGHKAPASNAFQFGQDVCEVMATRLTRAMTGKLDAAEACRMVGEKQLAAVQAPLAYAQAIMSGKAAAAPSAYFDVYRRAVKRNRKRLGSRRKRSWSWK